MYSKLNKKLLFKIKKNLFLEDLVDMKKSYKIYKMRNSLMMRKNSINKRKIKFNLHNKWFSKFICDNKIYLIKYNFQHVGYLRLEFKKLNKIEISIFIKQKFQNKNIASDALKFVTIKFKKYKFIAKVINSNLISRNFFEKNGFNIKNPGKKLFIIR